MRHQYSAAYMRMRDPWGFRALETELSSGIGNPNDYQSYQVGALTVSAEEREAVQVQVVQFLSDVDTAITADVKRLGIALDKCAHDGMSWDNTNNVCTTVPDPDGHSYPGTITSNLLNFRNGFLAPFLVDWEQFQTSWSQSVAVPVFEELKARFQQLVSDWKSMGQTTTAKPPAVATPGVVDDITDAAKSYGPWLIGGGILIAGLYLLGPAIASGIATSLVSRKRR